MKFPKAALIDIIRRKSVSIIESLGEPHPDNEYQLKPDEFGRWWIAHKHIGSGEPFEQFLNEFTL